VDDGKTSPLTQLGTGAGGVKLRSALILRRRSNAALTEIGLVYQTALNAP
jgi:hypothetical protein